MSERDQRTFCRVCEPACGLVATVRDGELVPVVFAAAAGALWSPIDGKPKAGRELERVRNLRADTRLCLLFDRYDADWERLWWLRVDGRGAVVAARGPDAELAAAALRAKYPRYASGATPLFGGEPTLLRIELGHWIGWAASAAAAADLLGSAQEGR